MGQSFLDPAIWPEGVRTESIGDGTSGKAARDIVKCWKGKCLFSGPILLL